MQWSGALPAGPIEGKYVDLDLKKSNLKPLTNPATNMVEEGQEAKYLVENETDTEVKL
jgi:hypothetical protein